MNIVLDLAPKNNFVNGALDSDATATASSIFIPYMMYYPPLEPIIIPIIALCSVLWDIFDGGHEKYNVAIFEFGRARVLHSR